MSRETVRAAVQTYLQNAGVTNLSTVFSFPPKLTPEGEFYAGQDPGHQSGAIIYIWIESQHETRIELRGAAGGGKMVEYVFILDCYLRSSHKKTELAAGDNESFLDSLVTAIRASKELGAPGVIFQAGEGGMSGGSDVEVTSYYPRNLNGAAAVTQVYSNIRLQVLEQTVS